MASMVSHDTKDQSCISIDPVALILSECVALTSAMRKDARWANVSLSTILAHGRPQADTSAKAQQDTVSRDAPATSSPLRESIPGTKSSTNVNGPAWTFEGLGQSTVSDDPLISAFSELRSEVCFTQNIYTFDAPELLSPFLRVIRSSSTSASITTLALNAVNRILSYNLVSRSSARLGDAMQLLAAALTHCRFEASNSSADEIVLLHVLDLMKTLFQGQGGELLSDASVCALIETALSMCCQPRLTELLRRSAEMTLISMCRKVFGRLRVLDQSEISRQRRLGRAANGESKAGSRVFGDGASSSIDSHDIDQEHLISETSVGAVGQESADAPFSEACMRETLRVLTAVLDPSELQHTDTMRIMALRVISVAFEVSGSNMIHDSGLVSLISDSLSKHLLQLIRYESLAILTEALRAICIMLTFCRKILKLQQELFLSYLISCLHPRLEIPEHPRLSAPMYQAVPIHPKLAKTSSSTGSSTGRSTPVPVKERQKLGLEGGSRRPEAREAMIETVSALLRIPGYWQELYENYDCDAERVDIFEDLVGLLARSALPDAAQWSTKSVPPLCLSALLDLLQMLDSDQGQNGDPAPSPQLLRIQRARKKVVIAGATLFNEDPKKGLVFLASQGILSDSTDPVAIANFLKSTSRISKSVLGEYLSKRSNEAILIAYLDLFDFSHKRVDEALRLLLSTFRLPGESALIERIVTIFSDRYCHNSPPDGVADKDAVFVLTYAIIILNTDQHNPNVKSGNRMTLHAFSRNLKGTNGGGDFTADYLEQIYHSIKHNEIILPEEHDNHHAFEYAWKELLLKADTTGELTQSSTILCSKDMFDTSSSAIVATMTYVFMSASESSVFDRLVDGFQCCARLGRKNINHVVFDRMVSNLGGIVLNAIQNASDASLNTIVDYSGQSITVSETAVRLGRDKRAQLALVILGKHVILGNEMLISTGWTTILALWLDLLENGLLSFEALSRNKLAIAVPDLRDKLSISSTREAKETKVGLFSSFASYISSYANDEPPEPSDAEMRDSLLTWSCIRASRFQAVFENAFALESDTVNALARALLVYLQQDDAQLPLTEPETALNHLDRSRAAHSTVVVLEMCSILLLTSSHLNRAIGSEMVEALQAVLRNTQDQWSDTTLRAVQYLAAILAQKNTSIDIKTPVVMHLISTKLRSSTNVDGVPVLQSLYQCFGSNDVLGRELADNPDFWLILQITQSRSFSSQAVMKILHGIIRDKPFVVSAHNYENIVMLLDAVASSARAKHRISKKQDSGHVREQANPSWEGDRELIDNGVRAIALICDLSFRAGQFVQESHLEAGEAWSTYWMPIFSVLSKQSTNPSREIRQSALGGLQRALLSPSLNIAMEVPWPTIFNDILFPLIDRLLKPEIFQIDVSNMGETRAQAAFVLCRVFLHFAVPLRSPKGLLDLWMKILDFADRLMNSGSQESSDGAITEALRNMILMMFDCDILSPRPDSDEHQEFWKATLSRLESFLPEALNELLARTKTTQPKST